MSSIESPQGLESIINDYAPNADAGLVAVVSAIGNASGAIGHHLKLAKGPSQAGTDNAFGDAQLDVDLAADEIIFDKLKGCGAVSVAASEEKPVEAPMGGSAERLYAVGFDPLDGSSIIDANFAVGSIFGIWPGDKLLSRTGREQMPVVLLNLASMVPFRYHNRGHWAVQRYAYHHWVVSCVTQYGPRTTMAVALSAAITGGDAVAFEVTFQAETRKWVVTRQKFEIASEGKVFAPGNLRATADHPAYKRLFNHWVDNRYTLRYTGGMVPDVYHILIKSKGIFTNVSSPSAKAKLRLLYECAPMALLIEAAGGSSVVAPPLGGEGRATPMSVLDVVIDNLDKRLGICLGGKGEVEIFKQFMF